MALRLVSKTKARSIPFGAIDEELSSFFGAIGDGIGKNVFARFTLCGSIFSRWISFSLASANGQDRK